MSLKAAYALVLGILSVRVMHAGNDISVSYYKLKVCAIKGSTATLYCRVEPPGQKVIWVAGSRSVDLKAELQYSGRVKYSYDYKWTRYILEISDVTWSDSAEYHCRVPAKQSDTEWTAGISLLVTDVQVKVLAVSSRRITLKCHSNCQLSIYDYYIWYENGKEIPEETSSTWSGFYRDESSLSCAAEGQEKFVSPPVYTPRPPSVSVAPSAIVEEGSSLTLNCSSDANPEASYTWHKENEDLPLRSGKSFTITDIRAEHNGYYYCKARNIMGITNSTSHLVTVAGGKEEQADTRVPAVHLGSKTSVIVRSAVTVFLTLGFIFILILNRRQKLLNRKSERPVLVCLTQLSSSDGEQQTHLDNTSKGFFEDPEKFLDKGNEPNQQGKREERQELQECLVQRIE